MRSPHLRIAGTVFSILLTASALAQQTPIQITANLTDAPRKLYHAEVDIPVKPGPLTLITPEWIPGDHRPTGPVSDIIGVVFTADGKTAALASRRCKHVRVPPRHSRGVTTLHAHLDCIVTARVSHKLAVLEWEKLLLYPADKPVRDIPIQPSLIVPAGWGVGTALTPIGGASGPSPQTDRPPISPPPTSSSFRTRPSSPATTSTSSRSRPTSARNTTSTSSPTFPKTRTSSPSLLAKISNLVREADAAYGSHHYNEYHFLLTLSDVAGGEGLEHGQSSDNGVQEKGFSEPALKLGNADLLSHEFTHSWNGKYRRPVGLYQPDFATAQQGALLWVYEGMTQYLGNVLAARSGLKNQAQYRDMLAMSAASLDYSPGRDWRSTEDTAVAASVLRSDDPAWSNWRRGQDYYQEGELVWLDADTLIRQKTNNQKSLTDFLKIFLGKGGNTGPLIVPYTFDELFADLNQVLPYDWADLPARPRLPDRSSGRLRWHRARRLQTRLHRPAQRLGKR